MTDDYRNALDAATARIAKLEDELEQARHPTNVPEIGAIATEHAKLTKQLNTAKWTRWFVPLSATLAFAGYIPMMMTYGSRAMLGIALPIFSTTLLLANALWQWAIRIEQKKQLELLTKVLAEKRGRALGEQETPAVRVNVNVPAPEEEAELAEEQEEAEQQLKQKRQR